MSEGKTSLDIDPIEEMKLKIQLATIESQKEMAIAQQKQAELSILNFRNTITRTCPEPLQQKILGYQVIEKTEYRDRVIKNGEVINDGATITKTDLCNRYGILTRNGKPDFKRLNIILENLGLDTESSKDVWHLSASIQESYQLKRDFLPQLDRLMTEGDRQICLGE